MHRRLHLTDDLLESEPEFTPPPPIPFPGSEDGAEPGWPLSSERRSTTAVADDILRTLDHLSVTLDDVRREIDSIDVDDDPPSAA